MLRFAKSKIKSGEKNNQGCFQMHEVTLISLLHTKVPEEKLQEYLFNFTTWIAPGLDLNQQGTGFKSAVFTRSSSHITIQHIKGQKESRKELVLRALSTELLGQKKVA